MSPVVVDRSKVMVTEYTQNDYHDYLTRTNINEITETNILNNDKE